MDFLPSGAKDASFDLQDFEGNSAFGPQAIPKPTQAELHTSKN